MSRLPVHQVDSCPPAQHQALVEWGRDRGQEQPPGRLWGMLVSAPKAMRPVGKLGAWVRVGTTLDPAVQEIGALVACAERNFRYEVDIHESKLRALGVDPTMVYDTRTGRPTELTPAQHAVAGLAYAMADQRKLTDEEVSRVIELLGECRFVEVITVVGYFLMLSDLAMVLEPDE